MPEQEKTEKKAEVVKRPVRPPVVRSETAADYARDAFRAGTILEKMDPHLKASVVLLTRGYGLDPLAGDVNILGTYDKPTIYITKQAWMKRLTTDPRYEGPIESRPMNADELKMYGNGDQGEVGWIWSCKMQGFAKPVTGWGTASPKNVKLENVSKQTDRRILLRMAEKRAQHDAAPQIVSFALDPNIWDRADAAMKERLQAAAEHITIAMDDGITDPERVAHLARARLITQEPPPTVAEVFEAAPEPSGLKEDAKPEDKPRPPQEDRAETPDASGQAIAAAEKPEKASDQTTEATTPVKCPHCGGPLDDGSNVCPNCKKPLPTSDKTIGDYEKETKEGQTRLWVLIEKLTGGDVIECENVLKEIAGTPSLTRLHGTDLKLAINAVEQRIKEKRGRAQQGELL